MLIDIQKEAIQRAKKLIENIMKVDGKLDPYNNNPSTEIYLLIVVFK